MTYPDLAALLGPLPLHPLPWHLDEVEKMARTETKAGTISTATLNAFLENFPTKQDWELKFNENYTVTGKVGNPWSSLDLHEGPIPHGICMYSQSEDNRTLTIYTGGGYIENLPAFVFEVVA